ncbi:hypothetical protein Tsubulata_037270 [Turnera subulata]|uniref:Uncharacterized protein n=1 Tax=Turnera subulata TaxID=218843 RepID=A0A9Q0F108_9ROSI|nr:hypothetical protein Tsubulata_037270 [Turnera subulata]
MPGRGLEERAYNYFFERANDITHEMYGIDPLAADIFAIPTAHLPEEELIARTMRELYVGQPSGSYPSSSSAAAHIRAAPGHRHPPPHILAAANIGVPPRRPAPAPQIRVPVQPTYRQQDSVDPDNMTYEELTELGQSIGIEKKGLSAKQISKLRTHKYKPPKNKKNSKNASSTDAELQLLNISVARLLADML